MTIAANYETIQGRIETACRRSGRSPQSVTLVGVTKKHPAQAITEALQTTPIRHFGENYVTEYVNKREQLGPTEAQWHFIGHLQRNKVRQLMAFPPLLIHSVDSPELAVQINRVSAEVSPDARQDILVELRIGDEDSQKTGIKPEDLPQLAQTLDDCRHLHWTGLMLIPPIGLHPEDSRPYFRQIRELLDTLNRQRTEKLSILSYGMSDDFEVAIEEGATHIRLGTCIFGPRQNA